VKKEEIILARNYYTPLKDIRNRLYKQSGGDLSKLLKEYQSRLQEILKDLLSYQKTSYSYNYMNKKQEQIT
jgi:hypothetical protein